jgi:hypothetical protein
MHASGRYIKGIDRCRPYRFVSVSDRVVRAYRRELFGKSILQDLPDKPTFVFNATNLESGVLYSVLASRIWLTTGWDGSWNQTFQWPLPWLRLQLSTNPVAVHD